ncbi:MAG: TonB-dependent receptor, partial [Bacteroidota bacterium]
MYKFAQCILAVVIMGMPAMAFGQSEMGQLAGRITDNSGQPLPGANIVLEDNERGTAADAFGRYNFRDLKPGNYNVLVTYVGFKSSTFLVEVKSGVLTRLDAKLHDDAAVIGEIVIQNEKFIRNLQETQTSVNVVSAEEIEALAIRDWREAGRIIGNFQNDAFGGFTIRGISINGVGFGGQGQTAQFYIDGVAQSSIGTRFGSRGVWDAEAFEVFRGPQSTVSGRNALIGSVAL